MESSKLLIRDLFWILLLQPDLMLAIRKISKEFVWNRTLNTLLWHVLAKFYFLDVLQNQFQKGFTDRPGDVHGDR